MNSLISTNWSKLFNMYFDIQVSNQFFECADKQLTVQFEQITGLKAQPPIRLTWSREDGIDIVNSEISSISAHIALKYGKVLVNILWRSKSDISYSLKDENIDCNDIEFWFDNLNHELLQHFNAPKWTLITFKEDFIKYFYDKCNLKFSQEFIHCMDLKLTSSFKESTGLKINKNISLMWPSKIFYKSAEISQCNMLLYVNHNWDPVTIKWQSKSGRIYKHHDTDIDCNDVTFWIEGLDVDLIYKQLYPKQILPFKLKDLGYELQVTRINIDCTLDINLREDCPKSKADELVLQANNFITEWNDKSEKRGRKNGVIHNWNYKIENDKIIYEIDLGSTGPLFFKKLLPFFSDFEIIEKIEIC